LQKRFLPIALLAASFIIFYSCTKIDTTTQGADLVSIDNITTKADTFDVDTQQGFFAGLPFPSNGDSTVIAKNSNHVIGQIIGDNLVGNTEASIFVQFKPAFFPFYFGIAGDTTRNTGPLPNSPLVKLDSVVLCLSYKGSWGDTSSTSPVLKFQVLQIDDAAFGLKNDTTRPVGSFPLLTTPSTVVLGEKDITINSIKAKTVFGQKSYKDSVDNQIRIAFSTTIGSLGYIFAQSLYNQDSSSIAATNNAFNSDAKFKALYKGFEIKITSANGKVLHYVNLAEAKSRLEFHYRKLKANVIDTLMQSFAMYPQEITGSRTASSSANYIKRDYGSSPVTSNTLPNTNYLFLQTSPGTYGSLKIPALSTLSNRIIHRAYLIVDQIPLTPAETDYFTPPPYLYVDLKDTVLSTPQRYKPVYFDLSNRSFYNPDATGTIEPYFPQSNVDLNTYDGSAQRRYDAGSLFYRYEINLTRYVQHIVTNKYKNYDLRLFAPYSLAYPQYEGIKFIIPYYNPVTVGRVRVGAGGLPRTNIHKMKMVVVYSLIK
jgi:hypothetical protein